MHYYKFNIADWCLGTAHLTLEEEAIYLRLINHYYDTEKPIPFDAGAVFRRLRITVDHEIAIGILKEFFLETEKGWTHPRCENILKDYRKTAKKNKANGAKGGRPKKNNNLNETHSKPTGLPNESQNNPNHKPLTTNQEPLTKNHKPVTNNQKTKNNFSAEADDIFSFWCQVMEKSTSAKFTVKRKRAVTARLTEGYTVDDIKLAITGCKESPFHQGDNKTNTVYDDLELICRDGGKLESFMQSKPITQSSTLASNIQSMREFIGNSNESN